MGVIPSEFKANAPTASLAMKGRRALTLLIIWMAGLSLSAAAFFFVRQSEEARIKREFDWRVRNRAEAFRESLMGYEEALYTLRNVFESAPGFNLKAFKHAAGDLLLRHPGIQLLQWMPHVKDAIRPEFESAAAQELNRPYVISAGDGPEEVLALGTVRPDYLPSLYVEPDDGIRLPFGFDYFRAPHQRAVNLALSTGKIAATRRFQLQTAENESFGWALFLPLYEPGTNPKSPEERRQKLRGFFEGEFRLNELIHDSAGEPGGALDLLLVDETPGGTEPYLISRTNGISTNVPPTTIAQFETGLHQAIRLPSAGRDWVLRARPSDAWLAQQTSLYPLNFCCLGLLLTSLLSSLVYNSQQRTLSIERLVNSRTSELRTTQIQLEEDLLHRLQMERERAQQEARLRMAIAAAELGTWEWDVARQKMIWPEQTEKIFGFTSGNFSGLYQDFLARVHPEDLARVCSTFDAALEDGSELALVYRLLWPDNSVHWVDMRGDVLRDETHGISRLIGIVLDTTEQRNAAEEKALIDRRLQATQKLESLGILAGGIAHDFNNLLTGILGNASLARMELPESSPAQEALTEIELVSQRAAELCKQMLAYSGKGHFVIQRLNLSDVIQESAHLLHLSISKNATLKFELAPELPPILADATQIRQILMNLVINASDAIGSGPGHIRVSTRLVNIAAKTLDSANLPSELPARTEPTEPLEAPGRALAPGAYVLLEVCDDGSGMSPETLAKIFDPFFTTKFTGRGLGLAAVLGIVRGHNGTLKVSSRVGTGTTFRLFLPKVDGEVEDRPLLSLPNAQWRGSGKILVVDDEEMVRTIASRMLRTMGFEVIEAEDGRSAIAQFQLAQDQIAAVLLDLTMPVMDGGETFGHLRQIRPDLRVLLMSGFNEQDATNRVTGLGMDAFLQKPFKFDLLQSKLREILPHRSEVRPWSA